MTMVRAIHGAKVVQAVTVVASVVSIGVVFGGCGNRDDNGICAELITRPVPETMVEVSATAVVMENSSGG